MQFGIVTADELQPPHRAISLLSLRYCLSGVASTCGRFATSMRRLKALPLFSMERSQIRRILEENVDGVVNVRWKDGSKQTVTAITVDDEGFVYDLIPPNPNTAFWSTFEEISEVTSGTENLAKHS